MWLVMKKEIKELVRDKKTLFFMIALPMLIFPLIMLAFGFFAKQAVEKAETKVLNYAVVGGQYAPALMDKLNGLDDLKRLEIGREADFASKINADELDFVLEIPANMSTSPLRGGQVVIKLHLNDAGLNKVRSRINGFIEELNTSRQIAAFTALNITDEQIPVLLEPVKLEKVDVSAKRENIGEKIGAFIPYILFVICLQGAMYPAIDLGAGEKERGTLETLLISPLDRKQLVLGKFITVALAGLIAALVTVASFAVWGIVLSQGAGLDKVAEFMSAIGIVDFVLVFLMLIPVVAIFAALLLAVSIYAKSFKEAQSYMGAIFMLMFFPIILSMLPGAELKGGWVWVPITNVALAIKELIKGTMDYIALVGIFASMTLVAGALLAFSIYWFKQERVLFR